ncbi:MAG: hypothetical protein GY756_00315 [bacterium]|nr:hypothetical protein [bacterium]
MYLVSTKRIILVWFIFIFTLLPIYAVHKSNSPNPTLDFIYIDSSVDESAGGHMAVRLDQTVFHYQYYPNGFFLLVKENWPEFKHGYNNLQNRTLSMASIPLSSETYQRIKTQFLTRYLLQNRRLFHLKQLETESDYLKNVLSSNNTIPINGLGFFVSKQKKDPTAALLYDSIKNKFGDLYISMIQQKLKTELEETVQNLQLTLLKHDKLSIYKASPFFTNTVRKYFELREFQEALCVLAEAKPVTPETLIHSSGEIGQLTKVDLKRLQQYRETIKNSILHLLTSSRPDKGTALLVQMARFQAISKSLEHKYLITLDPFSEKAELLTLKSFLSSYVAIPYSSEDKENNTRPEASKESLRVRTYFEQIKIEHSHYAKEVKSYFFSNLKNEDISFNQLEASLGRLWEINQAEENGRSLRVEGGILLPCKMDEVTVALNQNIKTSSVNINRLLNHKLLFEKQLYEMYNYNLISRNCVTELFETIYSCFSTANQANKELGGYLNPTELISFIPFMAFHSVKQKFPQSSIKILLSYRKRRQIQLYAKEGMWALLKESNTITSTIYYPWEEDSSFLFFTDHFILPRQLLGIGNVIFSTANSLCGIVWSPIDKGKLLKRSMRGIIFSLPELAFFNIRKGTFPAIAYED